MKIQANLYKDGKPMALTMSYDDGQLHDRRLVEIFDKYGIRGTFHLNSATLGGKNFVSTEEIPELYKNHEVSAHMLTHPMPVNTPTEELIYEVMEDRRILEKAAGYPVRGMSYPFGNYNDKVVDTLRALGMVYSRTTRAAGGFNPPEDFLLWHPTCHHRDNIMDKLQTFLNRKYKGGLFYVWGHSFEFDRENNWELIEEFCREAGGRDNVWYATNIELYDYITAQRRIVLSADRTMAYNPSAVSVWLGVDGEAVECKPGIVTKLA